RLPEYPDVPTLKELGFYDQWLGSSRCIAAPTGIPAEAVTFYAEAFEKLMQDPDYLKAAEAAGINTDYQDPAATAEMVSAQQAFAEGLDAVWGG
ncbi:MAG: tripartite tricarboxylate transporter substrate-binding protein, partial [Oscillospiraceae bacterium]